MWRKKTKKKVVTKLEHSNCDKTQKLKMWQNSKNQIMTKLKNPNHNSSNSKTIDNSNGDRSNRDIFSKTTWPSDNQWDVLGQLFAILVLFKFQGFDKLKTIKTLAKISPNTL